VWGGILIALLVRRRYGAGEREKGNDEKKKTISSWKIGSLTKGPEILPFHRKRKRQGKLSRQDANGKR